MRVGINFPWVSCGHDFGPGPPAWGSGLRAGRDFAEVERELTALSGIGLSLTRFFILAGGVNYPVGEDPLRIASLERTGEGRAHALARATLGDRARRALARVPSSHYRELSLHVDVPPPRLPSAFVEDFRALLAVCARTGVALIPSLVSFELFQPVVMSVGGIIKRGRRSFVLGAPDASPADRGARIDAFLDATLSPLLQASRDFQEAIYAWEVVNEPEWAVRAGPVQIDHDAYGLVPSLPLVDGPAMSDFIARGVERIAQAGFVATVGFGDPSPPWLDAAAFARLEALAAEGRYLHQRHHYPTLFGSHTLASHESSPITPCMLGELPTAMGTRRPDNVRWRDEPLRETEGDPTRYLTARLELARERGYPSALLWSLRSTDSRKAWGASQEAQLERALAGS